MLKQVIADIENMEYGKAFRMLRQHKIDINLLYDVNPDKFMHNISKFTKEVSQVDYLNLFINSLNEEARGKELEFMRPQNPEDLIRLEHQEFIKKDINDEQASEIPTHHKVNKICDALKQELWGMNAENKYLLPILTTYIKK